MITVEHDVRFSKLHAKRAEVIADLYSLLWEARAVDASVQLKYTTTTGSVRTEDESGNQADG